MSKTKSSWQQGFTKRLGNPRFRGTGWENLYATLSHASTTTTPSAAPFWIGVELIHGGPRYVGVLCADNSGEVVCTSELQRRTSALQKLRTQWPDGHLRFLTDLDHLRTAARQSEVFGAVVDAKSPAAWSLAESLAQEITIGNARTPLRLLTVISPPSCRRIISPPSSRRGTGPAGPLPPTPASFDVLLRSKTNDPWLEHRDLALMCAVQKDGLIGVDFSHVLGIFKESEYTGGQWVSRRLGLSGAKARGVARGPGRAERAAKKAVREIAASLALSQITGGIIDISGDARLAELRVAMETIRAACPEQTQFVLGCDVRGQGPFMKITFIAVTGRRSRWLTPSD